LQDSFRWAKERKVIYIPKKANPENPGDYRPLSMLEVLYKKPYRIQTKRLTVILPQIIGGHQHGFMAGKGIQEPFLIASHLIHTKRTRFWMITTASKPQHLKGIQWHWSLDHTPSPQSLCNSGNHHASSRTLHANRLCESRSQQSERNSYYKKDIKVTHCQVSSS
jgi:hypothetical protein